MLIWTNREEKIHHHVASDTNLFILSSVDTSLIQSRCLLKV